MKTPQAILLLLSFSFSCQLLIAAPLGGEVIGWGYNYGGQATGNTTNGSPGLVTIAGQSLTDVVAISAGQDHCLALNGDGTVLGWGYDQSGAATGVKGQEAGSGLVMIDGQVLSNVIAVSASTFSMALKHNGTVVVWGDEGNFSPPAGASNIVAISAGFNRGLALKDDGTVVGWGQIEAPLGLTNIVAIESAKGRYGEDLALRSNGTVVAWGFRSNIPAGLSNVTAIAAGASHSLALKRDGAVFGWGLNLSGGATGNASSQVSSGLVSVDGEVLTNVVAIAANGNSFSPAGHSLALKRDGSVVSWGYSPYHIMDVPAGLSNVVAIAAGENFCLAITTNRAVADKFRH
jgi:alpha-tubulin suppressor-like RCC1 family protein